MFLEQFHKILLSECLAFVVVVALLADDKCADGAQREDDWTCPSCGNVNFSFRTTCNMRNCTQSRPANHNAKFTLKPLQSPHAYSSMPPYVGSGAPSFGFMGGSPYGSSSVFGGSSIPRYDMPYSGASAYPYGYGNRLSGGSSYRTLSGLPPYSDGGSMIGNGGMYGMPPPMMDRYGLGMPMSHTAMGTRYGFYPEEPQKRDGRGDDDWTCPKCGNVNFSFRTVCNMRKCETPKPGSQVTQSDKHSKQKMPEGSWKCDQCGNINYPFREKCNRQNCGADKPSEMNNPASELDYNNEQ